MPNGHLPSKDWMWPRSRPEDVTQAGPHPEVVRLRRDRDELLAALEDVRARLHGANERADALIARIKSS